MCRHLLVFTTLVLILLVSVSASPVAAQTDRDCPDFTTQEEAQEYFEGIGGRPGNNADYLDEDGDGIACELLPAASSNNVVASNGAKYLMIAAGAFFAGAFILVRRYRASHQVTEVPFRPQPNIGYEISDPTPHLASAGRAGIHPGWKYPSPERLQELKEMGYPLYLETSEWKAKSSYMKSKAGYKCQLNSKHGGKLHAHHRTYDRIFHEEPEDLVVLCEVCHLKHHDMFPDYVSERR